MGAVARCQGRGGAVCREWRELCAERGDELAGVAVYASAARRGGFGSAAAVQMVLSPRQPRGLHQIGDDCGGAQHELSDGVRERERDVNEEYRVQMDVCAIDWSMNDCRSDRALCPCSPSNR